MTDREEFDKWVFTPNNKITAHKKAGELTLMWEGWQAAKADSEKEIAELKANTSRMVQAVSRAADAREAGMENEILELKKHINVLRDALEKYSDGIGIVTVIESMGETHIKYDSSFADIALSTTPAQSLTAYRNEVIEECAKDCELMAKEFSTYKDYLYDMKQQGADECADSIRELKGE